ncbi:CAAX prenyl protease 1 homolog isoform X1 [Drosophila bipectinata]|uniref:CAAX prenyl protease 1 homolog isoform X1 n=2 Tax=Drosophila bipectinata TaxID=42026 RepID=UPI0007E8534A|nr:CAAX prenyl protease 1 homolog isoform X1 [Drosophila bipectinata]
MAPLYEDPIQGVPLRIIGDGIGTKMIPDTWSLSDPILLRHVLVLVVLVNAAFHVVLCCRQLKMCNTKRKPPYEMGGVMSAEAFQESKDREMHSVWLLLTGYVCDAFFSIMDLYFGILAGIWNVCVSWYSHADLVWLNMAFMSLFTIYMVLRLLPQLFYEKLSLDPDYNVDPEKTPPLMGLLCTLAFVAVFLQLIVIPVTVIFVYIEQNTHWLFSVVVWVFLLLVTILVMALMGFFGVPCLGRSYKMEQEVMDDELLSVLGRFNFRLDRIHLVHTFHVGRPTAWVLGCCCCLRLDIHDNLKFNRGLAVDDLPSTHVGSGLGEEELAAFVAHQLAHWKMRHVPKAVVLIHLILLIYLIIFSYASTLNTLYKAADFTDFYPQMIGYWLVYKYLLPPVHLIATWIVLYFLRHFEYHADSYTYHMGYGSPMKKALLKLFADSFVYPYIDHAYLMWHLTQPSTIQRILHLQQLENINLRVSMISLI